MRQVPAGRADRVAAQPCPPASGHALSHLCFIRVHLWLINCRFFRHQRLPRVEAGYFCLVGICSRSSRTRGSRTSVRESLSGCVCENAANISLARTRPNAVRRLYRHTPPPPLVREPVHPGRGRMLPVKIHDLKPEGRDKPEARRPKSERNPKPEIRISILRLAAVFTLIFPDGGKIHFSLRPSDFFRISRLRISDLAPCPQSAIGNWQSSITATSSLKIPPRSAGSRASSAPRPRPGAAPRAGTA
jgi:hypothetical protein